MAVHPSIDLLSASIEKPDKTTIGEGVLTAIGAEIRGWTLQKDGHVPGFYGRLICDKSNSPVKNTSSTTLPKRAHVSLT